MGRLWLQALNPLTERLNPLRRFFLCPTLLSVNWDQPRARCLPLPPRNEHPALSLLTRRAGLEDFRYHRFRLSSPSSFPQSSPNPGDTASLFPPFRRTPAVPAKLRCDTPKLDHVPRRYARRIAPDGSFAVARTACSRRSVSVRRSAAAHWYPADKGHQSYIFSLRIASSGSIGTSGLGWLAQSRNDRTQCAASSSLRRSSCPIGTSLGAALPSTSTSKRARRCRPQHLARKTKLTFFVHFDYPGHHHSSAVILP